MTRASDAENFRQTRRNLFANILLHLRPLYHQQRPWKTPGWPYGLRLPVQTEAGLIWVELRLLSGMTGHLQNPRCRTAEQPAIYNTLLEAPRPIGTLLVAPLSSSSSHLPIPTLFLALVAVV